MGSDDGSIVRLNMVKLREHTQRYTMISPTTQLRKEDITSVFQDLYFCGNNHGYDPMEFLVESESNGLKTSGELVERLKIIGNEYLRDYP